MTLLTDALRKIDEAGDSLVYAVDPLSEDERALAERIVSSIPPVFSQDAVEESVIPSWAEPTSSPAVPSAHAEYHSPCAPSGEVPGRIRAAIAEAFGLSVRQEPAGIPKEPAPQTEPCRVVSQPAHGSANTQPEPVADDPASGVCHQITDYLGDATDGRVVAMVPLAPIGDGHPLMKELLESTARGLGEDNPSDVLVIDASQRREKETSTVVSERSDEPQIADLVYLVRSTRRQPTTMADLFARRERNRCQFRRAALPIRQAENTVADIVNFLDDCRTSYRWTLIQLSGDDVHDHGEFLARCDGVLVVMQHEDADARVARDLVRWLKQQAAPLIGAVVLEPPTSPRRAA